MFYEFCSKFHTLFSSQNFQNRLRFDQATDSLKVGTFLRHSVVLFLVHLFLHKCVGTSSSRS